MWRCRCILYRNGVLLCHKNTIKLTNKNSNNMEWIELNENNLPPKNEYVLINTCQGVTVAKWVLLFCYLS